MVRLIAAHYESEYRVWLRFNDGLEGIVDLVDELHGVVFEPLRDQAEFSRVTFNADIHTIVWPNGADLAPEYLWQTLEKSNASRRTATTTRSQVV